MSVSLLDATVPNGNLPSGGASAEEDVRTRIRTILGGSINNWQLQERRRDQRYPFPHLIYLTPVADDGQVLTGENLVAVGKHLSERGLDFYYQEPLPYRRMVVSLERPDGRFTAFLIDLTWCRFTRHGWYDNGGRFIRVVDSPFLRESTHHAPRDRASSRGA